MISIYIIYKEEDDKLAPARGDVKGESTKKGTQTGVYNYIAKRRGGRDASVRLAKAPTQEYKMWYIFIKYGSGFTLTLK